MIFTAVKLPELSPSDKEVPLKVSPLSMLFQLVCGTTPAESCTARLSAGDEFRPMKLAPIEAAQLELFAPMRKPADRIARGNLNLANTYCGKENIVIHSAVF